MRFSDARDDRGAARRTSRAATRPKTVLGRAESRRRRATPSSAGGLAARRRSTRGAAAVEARRSCRERDGARAIRAELDGRRSGARRESGARGDAALAWAARRRGRTLAGEWRRLRAHGVEARGDFPTRGTIAVPRAEPRARRRARRLCSAAPNRGGDGPRLRAPAVSRRAGGRRAARPRSKRVVPVANATAHERFAPSSTAAGAARGGKVALEATPRSPGPPGGEGERSRANGAVFGRTASRRDEIFRREGRSRCRAPNLARGDAPEDCARPRRIAAATGHAFERRRSRGAPAVDARRGRGRSASFLSRTRRRTSDSRRARRPPGAARGGKVALEATPRRLGRPAARANARGRMAPSSGARRRGAMRFSDARDDRGAARRTSRAATRPKTVLGRAESRRRRATPSSAGGLAARPAVDARRGRGRSASFQTRTRRRTSDSRRARRPPGAARGGKVALEATPRRLGRPAARANARGRMAPSSGARRRGAMRFSDARDDRGAARRTSRAATRPKTVLGRAESRRRRATPSSAGGLAARPAVDARRGPRSKRVVPDANATAHERFAPSSTAAGSGARRESGARGDAALALRPRTPAASGERRRLHTAMAPSSGAVGGHDSTKNSKRDETFFGEWSYNGRLYHKSLWSYRCIDRVRYRLRSVGVVKVISGTSCSSALTSSSSSSTLASSSLFPY